jgi:hypothetical protein
VDEPGVQDRYCAVRGECILPLFFCGEGIPPSNRGQDVRDTQGRDALATGLHDGDLTRVDRNYGHAPKDPGYGRHAPTRSIVRNEANPPWSGKGPVANWLCFPVASSWLNSP